MGKKRSGPGKSSTLTSKRHPRGDVRHICDSPLTASEGLSGTHPDKGSKESAEQVLAAASGPPERPASRPFPIVGVGASAGGLEAFTSFLKALPADTGMAFVLVQHMDPAQESMLHRLLAKDTAMPVLQVKEGMAVETNCVYVIPPNTTMTIHKGTLRLAVRPGRATRHTPIDSFLSALAEDQQGLAIGVILSGIGFDGTKGLQSIKAKGGISFAQDQDSAKFPGMPLSAVAAGCVDLVLSPDRIARELARMRRHPYLELVRSPVTAELPGEDGNLRLVLQFIRSATGVDFTHYKRTTVIRRIFRRMLVRRCENLAQYVTYVEGHPDEVRALFQDLLVHITSFFREPAVFRTLQDQVFPRITASLTSGESLRIWVPGCSTGEEVYSLAIAWHEYFGEAAPQGEIKIFGTDLSETNVEKARAATYSEASTEGLSAERLRRFFVKIERGYRVDKRIREMCVFARHDLTEDPPFTRMDMISCRNVLIYLTPVLQRKVLDFIHYALKPTGFLVLGNSESPSAVANLFSLEYRRTNIYSKVDAPARPLPEFPPISYEDATPALPLPPRPRPSVPRARLQTVVHQEAASEKLRAANEEILSSNEELQSTNEELQTAQEELQSANEELTALNEELRDRNLELSQTANDLSGVLNAVEIPILIVDNDRRIRRFTPAAGHLLNLLSTDVGRLISQVRPNLEIPDLAVLASEVIDNKRPVQREVRDEGGHWYAFRMRPYQLGEDKIEAILTMVDITDIKQSASAVVETVRESLLVLDSQFRITSANPAFYEKFHLQREKVENRLLFELGQGQWNSPRLRELLEKVLPEKEEVVDFELQHDFPVVGHKIMLLTARQLYQGGIGSQKILLVMEDITERRAAENKIHQLLARLTTAREEEGRRIARELHDTLGPRLALLNLKVFEVEGLLSSPPDLARGLEEIRNEISNAGKITHDLAHELHPSALSQLGLAAALQAECAVFSKRGGTAVTFSGESVPALLPDEVALCLYRVALASLENIRQHAQANKASVRLVGTGSDMGMVIQDFGRGFDVHTPRNDCALGLVSMEERVRLVNGTLSVNSIPGKGTRVEVRIPLVRV